MKNLFYLANRFFYRNFKSRDLEKALFHIADCKGLNSVLKTDEEIENSLQKLKALNLWPHCDRAKCWDAYSALSFILKNGSKQSSVLDVGCASYGVILPWLESYDFSNLFGCDLSFRKDFQKSKIKYFKQDLQKTFFPSNYFDFITSISVIEHGVNIDSYLTEMSRLLKRGGHLITSADYWPEPVNTRGLFPYGKETGEMRVFTREDIETLVLKAKDSGLRLIEPIDFAYKDKVIHWKRVDRRFTFIFFILAKK